jgi:hypothetical protein
MKIVAQHETRITVLPGDVVNVIDGREDKNEVLATYEINEKREFNTAFIAELEGEGGFKQGVVGGIAQE